MDWLKKNRLWMALGVLVVLVGLALSNQRGDDTEAAATEPQGVPELPDLSASEIDALTIRRPDADEPVIELRKRDGAWRLVQPVEAEAQASSVQTALDKLADLEVERVAARNPENHARLEVTDEAGVHVVAEQAGETLASLIFGAYGGGETMVRMEGEDVVFAVRGSVKFAFDKDAKNWRDRRIADVPATDVQSIEFAYGDTRRTFVRDAAGQWAQGAGDAPIESFSGSKVSSVVSRLAQLRANDFAAPDVTRESAGLAEPASRVVLRYEVTPASEDAEGADAEGETDGDAAPTVQEIVFLLGAPVDAEDGPHYLAVEGRDTIYRVTNYYAKTLRPTDEDFAEDPEAEEGEDAADPAAALGAGGGTPTGDIPPEVMRQIQQQMQAQGMGN